MSFIRIISAGNDRSTAGRLSSDRRTEGRPDCPRRSSNRSLVRQTITRRGEDGNAQGIMGIMEAMMTKNS